jgi:toxin ParE1/3/4
VTVEWADSAFADFRAISQYIEQNGGIEAANRVSRGIYESIQTLRTMPYRGRPGKIADTRELVVPGLPYVAFYRVIGDRVRVFGIVHGARNWP